MGRLEQGAVQGVITRYWKELSGFFFRVKVDYDTSHARINTKRNDPPSILLGRLHCKKRGKNKAF